MDEAELHRALVERSYDLTVALDASASIVWVSPRLTEVLGHPADAVTGRPALGFVHPDDVAVATDGLAVAFAGETPEDPTVVRLSRADGSWAWFDVVGGDLGEDPALAPARFALYLREVTHRTESERAARAERDAAEAALRRSEERFRALVLHANDAIVVVGADGTIEQANPDRGLYGPRPVDEVLGRSGFEFVHADDVADLQEAFGWMADEPGRTTSRTFRIRDRWDRWRWIEATATNMVDHPAVEGIVVNYRDVTERVEAQRGAQRLLEVLEATEDLVGISDPHGRLLHLNQAAREFAGLDDDLTDVEVPGAWMPPEEADRLVEEVLPALERAGTWAGELRLCDGDGRELPVLARMISHADAGGEVEFYSWNLRDISDRIAREEHLAHRASHDPLTGLPNRAQLVERLTGALAPGADHVAALFVDLDEFKALNDRRGHAVGDVMLKEIATRIQSALRPQDTVARYGGDEFVVVVEGITDEAQAVHVAGRVLQALAEPLGLEDEPVHIGASIGIATTLGPPDQRPDAARLLAEADAAMYRAKQTGRGRIAVHRGDA